MTVLFYNVGRNRTHWTNQYRPEYKWAHHKHAHTLLVPQPGQKDVVFTAAPIYLLYMGYKVDETPLTCTTGGSLAQQCDSVAPSKAQNACMGNRSCEEFFIIRTLPPDGNVSHLSEVAVNLVPADTLPTPRLENLAGG